ncbi:MAG TPA: Rid family detoxifying hydrolase [Candidatus Limnocylindria bacterium]|nr:Rid family detoxifying hydrolase [Candidatus Limnocylindria bacterium]
MRTVLLAPSAPAPVGPYSVGIATETLVFCAAQAGLDPTTGRLAEGGTGPETEQALANLAAVLAADGLTFADVVKSNLYLLDMNDWAAVNEIYGRAMGPNPPALTTVGVASLPIGARIEIDMVAARRER